MMRSVQPPLGVLNRAKVECLRSTVKRARMCALLMSGKRFVFSVGHNRATHGSRALSIHAEEDLLNKIKRPFGTLIVLRYLAFSDQFGNSRPCDRCMARIVKTCISRVVYCLNGVFYQETLC